jgi:hypothetical protein
LQAIILVFFGLVDSSCMHTSFFSHPGYTLNQFG